MKKRIVIGMMSVLMLGGSLVPGITAYAVKRDRSDFPKAEDYNMTCTAEEYFQRYPNKTSCLCDSFGNAIDEEESARYQTDCQNYDREWQALYGAEVNANTGVSSTPTPAATPTESAASSEISNPQNSESNTAAPQNNEVSTVTNAGSNFVEENKNTKTSDSKKEAKKDSKKGTKKEQTSNQDEDTDVIDESSESEDTKDTGNNKKTKKDSSPKVEELKEESKEHSDNPVVNFFETMGENIVGFFKGALGWIPLFK